MVNELLITTDFDCDKRGVIFPTLKSELTISQIGKILGIDKVGRLAFEMERCNILHPLISYAQKNKYSQRDLVKIYAVSEMIKEGARVTDIRHRFVGVFPYADYIPGVQDILEKSTSEK